MLFAHRLFQSKDPVELQNQSARSSVVVLDEWLWICDKAQLRFLGVRNLVQVEERA